MRLFHNLACNNSLELKNLQLLSNSHSSTLPLTRAFNNVLTEVFFFRSDQEDDDKDEEPHCLKVQRVCVLLKCCGLCLYLCDGKPLQIMINK